ncbi:exo-alpha-sialidase [Streptomyces sp. N35]|uniref:exo-alpha-sialidase n=1 Tax=Streptomyces sp. N35 TaxID=2795730 RepID=UPI0018F38A85|nr:exo-alpha-sialidase [Streptomyces sp. N35]
MNGVYVRRVLAALLGALALLLAGCGEVGDRRGGEPGDERASQPKAAGAASRGAGEGADPPRIPSADGLPGWAHSLGFAADGSGFVLLAQCPEGEEEGTGDGCVQRVAVLGKGARQWRVAKASPLANTAPDWGVTADVLVLGPGRALIREGRSMIGDRTWYTADGGRTWRKGTVSVQGTVASVPAHGQLVSVCGAEDAEGNGCGRARLAVIMPDSGEHRALAQQPPLDGVVDPAGEAAGDLYVQGKAPGSGRPTLAVSSDRGRTWKESPLTGAATAQHGTFTLVSGRAGIFALQRGGLPEGEGVKNGLLTIHKQNASDMTWTRVWSFRPGVEPRSVLGAIAADDNSLTVYGEHGVWTSDTGGRTFHQGEGSTGVAGSAWKTPIGWLWASGTGQGTYRISSDGVHWHTFQLSD